MCERVRSYLCPVFPLRGKHSTRWLWAMMVVAWVNGALFLFGRL